MISLLISVHLAAFAVGLGGRVIFIPVLRLTLNEGINERLDELDMPLQLSKWSDYGLAVSIISGIALFVLNGIPVLDSHWAFKLKLVALLLLVVDVGAFHIAKMRIRNHYDTQMIPAVKRLNSLAVILMLSMVFFAVSMP